MCPLSPFHKFDSSSQSDFTDQLENTIWFYHPALFSNISFLSKKGVPFMKYLVIICCNLGVGNYQETKKLSKVFVGKQSKNVCVSPCRKDKVREITKSFRKVRERNQRGCWKWLGDKKINFTVNVVGRRVA